MKNKPLYLDYAATTPVDARVLEAMLPYFTDKFGNAASTTHIHGEEAKKAVDRASTDISDLINAYPDEIIYTSGATEAINTALKGLYWSHSLTRSHIITVKTEHKAVLDTCRWLEEIGSEVTYLNVDHQGLIDWEEYASALKLNPLVVCIMHANNETGVIQEIGKIAQLAKESGAYFMTDATQSFGKMDIDVVKQNIDLLCFSAHKIYGPKGIGGLYIKRNIKLTPLIHGGGHQRNYRSGTLNVPGIVGLGEASKIAKKEMREDAKKLQKLRDQLEHQLIADNMARVNGSLTQRLPNISNFEIINCSADEFLLRNKNLLSASTGSACSSEVIQHSHVLAAMNIHSPAVRLSFGKATETAFALQLAFQRI
ncbi:Cysteine desulfurase [Fulvivirga imtechensis AK7]|uniref:cysteine desulfurase n=1 Tax=Fulvivirga imtechensis AK7 TaxID=1237149 RepID=L8JTX7_9BACT|nr:cysteine desulfurase family protein [Fulvivirga imtechensis]ELR71708.1 Cysteine desulfurase [Fulvivirga imtechensis AK7]